MTESNSEGSNHEARLEMRHDGTRLVSWDLTAEDGKTLTVRHSFPDAVQHHYRSTSVNEDVLLYSGPFTASGGGSVYDGDVRFRWLPSPHVEFRGEAPVTAADLTNIFQPEDEGMWVSTDEIEVDLPGGSLPQQPDVGFVAQGRAGTMFTNGRVQQEIGDPRDLESVTFLVPNGWDSSDGIGICDAARLDHTWHGRTEASGDGWEVILDSDPAVDRDSWRELAEMGGHRFTHTGRIVRRDGSPFTGEQAFEALSRVRLGLNLALGRRTTCSLPVGWRNGQPVWCRWFGAPVDGFCNMSHWLDQSVGSRQIHEIVSCVLEFTSDQTKRDVLQHALSYYVAANVDVQVDLAVALPVSGLQLLSFFQLVSEGSYSRAQWDILDTEGQLRLLLNDVGVNTAAVPERFENLGRLQIRLGQKAPSRDALGVIMKLRNVVTHPSRDQPGDFSVYEWAEAGMLVRYWFCLALLKMLGYHGQIAAPLTRGPHWTGQVETFPGGTPVSM